MVLPGLVLNAINVIIFARMGLADSTNISLLGLTLADIGVLLTMVGLCVLFNPLTLSAAPSMDIIDAINYIVLGTPLNIFSRISGLITGFISLERLLCVAWPLHIKFLVTKQRTVLVVVGAYALMFTSGIPTFIAHPIGMRFNPVLNATVVGLVFSANTEELENISVSANIAAQTASFVVVTVSTVFLTRSLHRSAQWRGAIHRQASKSSARDKQLVKMVVLISATFIACSLPLVVVNAVMPFRNEFSFKGREKNVFMLTCGVFFALQSINASVNFFVYLAMSSKFKQNLYTLLGLEGNSSDSSKSRDALKTAI
ncbi:unnamed protein product [Lymnaea stagnalis]|uniref:G-protein coupled receptors family 1 profile domain-containing protein n=1 Tax=Lymnaea stagnalis TaxID=6523 RepID=A0AAV2HVU9_LYMST